MYKQVTNQLIDWLDILTKLCRLGWYEAGQGSYDRENYDDRFKFSHQTAEFIKTQAMVGGEPV